MYLYKVSEYLVFDLNKASERAHCMAFSNWSFICVSRNSIKKSSQSSRSNQRIISNQVVEHTHNEHLAKS